MLFTKRITVALGARAAGLTAWVNRSVARTTPIYAEDYDAWETAIDQLARGVGQVRATAAKTTSYFLTHEDAVIRADATPGTFTLTLPTAPQAGTTFHLLRTNVNSNNVRVSRGGTALIGGATGVALITLEYGVPTTLVYNGTDWDVLG